MGKLISQRRARNRMQLHLQTCNWRLATSNWRLATEGNQNASSATNLTPRKREICGKRKNEARNKISSRSSAVSVQFSWCCCCWVSPHMASSFQLLVSTGYWLLATDYWPVASGCMPHAPRCQRALGGSQRHQDLSQIKAGRPLIQFKCCLRHSENGKLPTRCWRWKRSCCCQLQWQVGVGVPPTSIHTLKQNQATILETTTETIVPNNLSYIEHEQNGADERCGFYIFDTFSKPRYLFSASVGVASRGGVVLGSFRMPTSDSQVGLQRSSVLVFGAFVCLLGLLATTRHRYVCRSCLLAKLAELY